MKLALSLSALIFTNICLAQTPSDHSVRDQLFTNASDFKITIEPGGYVRWVPDHLNRNSLAISLFRDKTQLRNCWMMADYDPEKTNSKPPHLFVKQKIELQSKSYFDSEIKQNAIEGSTYGFCSSEMSGPNQPKTKWEALLKKKQADALCKSEANRSKQ